MKAIPRTLEASKTRSRRVSSGLFRLLCLIGITGFCPGSDAAILPIEVWGRTNQFFRPTALVVDSGGNTIVTGTHYTETGEDILTIKYSSEGEPLWTNRFDGLTHQPDRPSAIGTDTNGDIFITGESYGGSASLYDFVTIKYSKLGLPLWTNYYDYTNRHDQATDLAVTPDGDVVVTGKSSGGGISSDFATIRYSSAGIPLWVSRYNNLSNGLDEPVAVRVAENGNVVVAGFSYLGDWPEESDYAIVAYSSSGGGLWTNYYNGPADNWDWVMGLAVDTNSNVFVTGFSRGEQEDDYATLKYSSAGVALWTNRYNGGGNSGDQAWSIAVDPIGDIIVTGSSQSGLDFTSADYATVKYSNSGIPIWTNRLNGPANLSDSANGITTDAHGNVYVIGYVDLVGGENSSDGLMVKYSASGDTLWTKTFEASPGGTVVPAGKAMAVGPDGAVHVSCANGDSVFTAKYSDLVKLEISLSGSTVEVSWPSGALGWRLEAKSALSAGNSWSTVTNSTFTNRVHFPATNIADFFRLAAP